VRSRLARLLNLTHFRSDGKMQKFLSKYQCDWGHIGFLIALLFAISFFLTDAFLASRKAENLMMILPVSLIGIGICLWQIRLSVVPRVSDLSDPGRTHQSALNNPSAAPVSGDAAAEPASQTRLFKYRVPIFMGLLGLYLMGLIYVAFDLATFLFIWLSLVFQGERRKVVAFVYALLFALGVTWCLKLMVPFPFTTLFF
jgi:hypothetical protein